MSRAKGTLVPDQLSDEQREQLRDWLYRKHPRFLARRFELEEACLDHHRSRGNRMVDWLACVRTWTRNAVRFAERDAAVTVVRHIPERTPPCTPEEMAELAMRRERERKRMMEMN